MCVSKMVMVDVVLENYVFDVYNGGEFIISVSSYVVYFIEN